MRSTDRIICFRMTTLIPYKVITQITPYYFCHYYSLHTSACPLLHPFIFVDSRFFFSIRMCIKGKRKVSVLISMFSHVGYQSYSHVITHRYSLQVGFMMSESLNFVQHRIPELAATNTDPLCPVGSWMISATRALSG